MWVMCMCVCVQHAIVEQDEEKMCPIYALAAVRQPLHFPQDAVRIEIALL